MPKKPDCCACAERFGALYEKVFNANYRNGNAALTQTAHERALEALKQVKKMCGCLS